MHAVSVIIPSLDGEKLLPVALESLQDQTFQDFDVVVVDNGSKDRSLELLKSCYPSVKVVALQRNLGFAGAVNRGIEASAGEFVAVLNNDVEAHPRWLEELRAALIEHAEAGSAGPKMLRYFERNQINILGLRLNRTGEIELVGAGEDDHGQYDQARYVFGVSAGAALYRRKMLDEIGLFDEEFFANHEDVDLAFRAQLAGYKALYVPSALAYHMVGSTIRRRRYLPTYLNNRNKILFFWKNMPGEIVEKHFQTICRHQAGTFLKRILLNFYKLRTFYYLKGTASGVMHIPYILRQRKKIRGLRRVSVEYIESIMDRDFL
jgi:GT2 family glycosyltransferase